jgi:hypothetical protein
MKPLERWEAKLAERREESSMMSSSRLRFVALAAGVWLFCHSSIMAQVRRPRPAPAQKAAEDVQEPDEPIVSVPEPSDPIAAMREWHDTTGQHSIKAKMQSFEQGATETVTLAKEDGKSVKVPLAKLSDADKELITAFAIEDSKRVIAKAAVEFVEAPLGTTSAEFDANAKAAAKKFAQQCNGRRIRLEYPIDGAGEGRRKGSYQLSLGAPDLKQPDSSQSGEWGYLSALTLPSAKKPALAVGPPAKTKLVVTGRAWIDATEVVQGSRPVALTASSSGRSTKGNPLGVSRAWLSWDRKAHTPDGKSCSRQAALRILDATIDMVPDAGGGNK